MDITFDQVERYVQSRLDFATHLPRDAYAFEMQVFGVIDFMMGCCAESKNPTDELVNRWHDEWRPLFHQLYKED